MKGLILAAGMGSRLGEYANNTPKVMVEVNNRPLLFYALDRFCEQGIGETIIVVGYKKDYIIKKCGIEYKGMKLTFVENDKYSTTNNVYSFYLATKYINDEVLMAEGDILFSKHILDHALMNKIDCNIVVSRFNPSTMNGTVIRASDNVAKELIIKKNQYDGFDYSDAWKTVNIYYFSKAFMSKFSCMLELYVKIGNLSNYYELVLGALIYYGDDDIRIVPVDEDKWFEIDDKNDLMYVREHYSNCKEL